MPPHASRAPRWRRPTRLSGPLSVSLARAGDRPRGRRAAVVVIASAALLASLLAPVPASAADAPVVSATGLTGSVSGTTFTASASFSANPRVASVTYGVCVVNASGARFDLSPWTGALGAGVSSYRASRSLAVGTYWYAACVKGPSGWVQLGAAKSVTVVATAAAPAATSTMPKGDLAGWKQVMAEDFTTAVPLGQFPGSTYKSRFFAYGPYADTTGRGWYDPAKVLSVKDGVLDWYIHTESGKPRVAAVVPKIPATGWGQTYGRYSVRFRSDSLENYKMVAMLWPDSDNWGEGEIDFMEVGELDWGNTIYTNLYPRGSTATWTPGKSTGFRSGVRADGNGWHVATLEWAPGSVTYWIDGVKLGTTTSSAVPSTPMHAVIQVETAIGLPVPPASEAGHVQVDWIVQYSRR